MTVRAAMAATDRTATTFRSGIRHDASAEKKLIVGKMTWVGNTRMQVAIKDEVTGKNSNMNLSSSHTRHRRRLYRSIVANRVAFIQSKFYSQMRKPAPARTPTWENISIMLHGSLKRFSSQFSENSTGLERKTSKSP
jgi:hypothetical protein